MSGIRGLCVAGAVLAVMVLPSLAGPATALGPVSSSSAPWTTASMKFGNDLSHGESSARSRVVTQPAHALYVPGTPRWLSVVELSVKRQSDFKFEMHLAGNIPLRPSLLGGKIVDWVFAIDSDTSAAPEGWPGPQDLADPSDYQVVMWWDGTRFTAGVANRIPLLSGGAVLLTEVPFSINGDELKVWVRPPLIGDPVQLAFNAYTETRIQADVKVDPVTHEIVALPVTSQISESEFAVQGWAPYADCSYTDDFGFCWVNWSAAANGRSAVVALGWPSWMSIVSASLTGSKVVTFQLNLGSAIPEKPEMLGGKLLLWFFLIDTNRTSNPPGWPFPGRPDEDEYVVLLAYDGKQFAAILLDRTPVLSGGDPAITPIHFETVDQRVRFRVPMSAIGSPAEFGVISFTSIEYTELLQIVSPVEVFAGPGSFDRLILMVAGFPPFCSYFDDLDGHCYTTYNVHGTGRERGFEAASDGWTGGTKG